MERYRHGERVRIHLVWPPEGDGEWATFIQGRNGVPHRFLMDPQLINGQRVDAFVGVYSEKDIEVIEEDSIPPRRLVSHVN